MAEGVTEGPGDAEVYRELEMSRERSTAAEGARGPVCSAYPRPPLGTTMPGEGELHGTPHKLRPTR